jgi:polyadenylate-binding protein
MYVSCTDIHCECLQAQFAQMRTPVGPAVPTTLPMYHPGAPGMGQQIYYGQPPPGLIPPQVG